MPTVRELLEQNNQPTIKNSPRNGAMGTLADILQAVKGKTGMVGDLILGQAPKVLDDMSYGYMPVQGSGMTTQPKQEAIDLLNLTTVYGLGKPVINKSLKAIR